MLTGIALAALGYVIGQVITALFFIWWISRPAEAEALQSSQPPRLWPPPTCRQCRRVGGAECQCELEREPDPTA